MGGPRKQAGGAAPVLGPRKAVWGPGKWEHEGTRAERSHRRDSRDACDQVRDTRPVRHARWCYSFIAMVRVKTIDAHAAGEPLRLIVDGFPSPRGKTMLDKREWLRRHADHLRRALMLEPRGHADMYGAILTEPVSPGSHAGVLFMHNEGLQHDVRARRHRRDDDRARARAADAGRRRRGRSSTTRPREPSARGPRSARPSTGSG